MKSEVEELVVPDGVEVLDEAKLSRLAGILLSGDVRVVSPSVDRLDRFPADCGQAQP